MVERAKRIQKIYIIIALFHCKRNFLWYLQVAQVLIHCTLLLSDSKYEAHKTIQTQSSCSET
jgi:hypothetical protein